MGTNQGFGYVGVRETGSALDVARISKLVFPAGTLTATSADEVEYIAANQLLSTGTITVGADTDASGTDTITLQTRALTRLQITNAGNVSIVNKLGINQPIPISAIHIKPTYAIDVTSGEQLIRFSPPNAIADFTFRCESTVVAQTNTDDVVMWGWNIDQTGGEPRIHFAMEREYLGDWEIHIEGDPSSHAIIRYWTWNINRATGFASHIIRADTFHLIAATAGTVSLTVENDPGATNEVLITGNARVQGDIFTHETSTNAGATNKQISLRSHPSDAAQSWLVFGDPGSGGGASVTRHATYPFILQFSSAGDDLTDGCWLWSNRMYASAFYHQGGDVQVVGAQGAAVADPTGGSVIDVECRAQLAALLSRVRTHGLIA